MRKILRTILLGFILIQLLDTMGSILSRQMNFNYGYLFPFSFVIYTAIPFVIAKRADKKIAVISGGVLALFDATVGWKLSILLRANAGNNKLHLTTQLFITTIIFVTLSGILLGLLGSWIALKLSANKKQNE